jgi:hypothetical protein
MPESFERPEDLPEELYAREQFEQRQRSDELVRYANKNSVIMSLLYDLDLMPEQVDEFTAEWFKMNNVIAHFKQAIEDVKKS